MSAAALPALVRNDLRLYATDRRAMVVGILVPILIAAFFGYVFGGTGSRGESGRFPSHWSTRIEERFRRPLRRTWPWSL